MARETTAENRGVHHHWPRGHLPGHREAASVLPCPGIVNLRALAGTVGEEVGMLLA